MNLMSSLGGLLGRFGIGGGGTSGQLLGMVEGFVERQGGMSGLLEKFRSNGMAQQADSWVGDGPNEPVSADQVRQALGDEEIERVAQATGASKDQAASGLAAALPDLVNKVTPGGKIPDASELRSLLGGLSH
jgi:uncharacterized protein YidB (DUF937 family)